MARTPAIIQDRREQIIDAALRVFAQKGFNGATNKDIAKEAGITPGLIYHYFANKEELLRATIEEHSPIGFLRVQAEHLFAEPPEVFLRLVSKQILEITESESFVLLLRVFLPEVVINPGIITFNLAAIREVTEFLVRYIDSKMDSGEMRRLDASLIVQMFTGTLFAFVVRRQILHDPSSLQFTHEQIVEAVVTTLFDGLHPK